MNARLQRRSTFEVRRDASTQLTNGRVLYDAFFSRWGMQVYPGGVEYRPAEEVFSDASLASLSALPGVLLHPSKNYGTEFGAGAYPVRGCSTVVVAHPDGIHTSGQLMVWDAEWNAQIQSGETSELSVGFTVDPDPTPGTAPEGSPGSGELGLEYVSIQRDIIGDHHAGVPEGNAGTARVILDAQRSLIPTVTRRALADIAAQRMDARPLVFDLGSWPRRQTQDKDPMISIDIINKLKGIPKLPARAVHDAILSVMGEPDDPAIVAALAELAAMPEPEQEPPAEGEETPAPEQQAADEDESDEGGEKMDAARLLALSDARADALTCARSVFGLGYTGKLTSGARMDTAAIKRAVVGKLDPSALEDVSRMDAKTQGVGLELAFARAQRQIADAAIRKPIEGLLAKINEARRDGGEETLDEGVQAIAARLREINDTAASSAHGHTTTNGD